MRYPTRALLRCLRRKDRGTGFWLPVLTAKKAWRLTEFLDEIQEAIWMDYGQAIADYLDGTDCHPPSPEEASGATPTPSSAQETIEF